MWSPAGQPQRAIVDPDDAITLIRHRDTHGTKIAASHAAQRVQQVRRRRALRQLLVNDQHDHHPGSASEGTSTFLCCSRVQCRRSAYGGRVRRPQWEPPPTASVAGAELRRQSGRGQHAQNGWRICAVVRTDRPRNGDVLFCRIAEVASLYTYALTWMPPRLRRSSIQPFRPAGGALRTSTRRGCQSFRPDELRNACQPVSHAPFACPL